MRTSTTRVAAALVCAGLALGPALAAQDGQSGRTPEDDGFTDTPMLPGLPYHVHDPERPHPPVVTPGTGVGLPPSDALVQFDGTDLSAWSAVSLDYDNASYAQTSDPAPWRVGDGYFEVVPGTGEIATRATFGDVQLHVEWAAPADAAGHSQNRGNSGILLMGLYEVQVLDTWNNPTYADGTAGAIYGQWPPLANAVRPPGEWQSYDIVFEAPVFDGDRLVEPAYFTVFVNGVLVHNRQASMGRMIWRQVASYRQHPAEGPILLQDHGTPVRYRNIWVRPLGTYDQP